MNHNNVALLDKLHNDLDREINWRKKEISNLFLHIKSQEGDIQISLIRGAIVLLYAHWEGFVKKSSIKYLKYISKHNYDLKDLTENFCYLSLGVKFPNSEFSTNNINNQKEIFDYIGINHKYEKLKIKPETTIDTGSNLKYDVFENICKQLGIDSSWYETKKNFINKRLLGLRNPIAHGEIRDHENLINDYVEFKDEVLKFIEKFKELIVDASENQKFLRVRD